LLPSDVNQVKLNSHISQSVIMKKGQIGLGSIDYHSQGEANTIADADIAVESQQMINGRKSGSRKSSNRLPRANRSGGIIQQQK